MRFCNVLGLTLVTVAFAACGSGTTKKVAANNGGNNATTANNGNPNNGKPNNGVSNNGTTSTNANNTISSNNSNNRDYSTCFEDEDGDGFGAAEQIIDSLCAEAGLAEIGGDCDDTRDDVYPGADELACDGVDRNCDEQWHASVPTTCPTIQAALDAAASTGIEGVVDVEPGVYRENIAFNGAHIHLRGAGPETTRIQSSSDTTVVRFDAGEDDRSVLEGFTITGGSGFDEGGSRVGGGIYVNDADPALRNLVVSGNEAGGSSGYGGGISLARSNSLVEDVVVVSNGASYYGGGVHVSQGGPSLRRMRIVSNGATYGGGMAIYFSNADIQASIIAQNSASYGGGVLLQGDAPFLRNLTVLRNDAEEGGGISCSACDSEITNVTFHQNTAALGGAIFNEDGSPLLGFVNLYSNGASEVSGLTVAAAPGVQRVDSMFASLAGGPLNWDLHLQASSPLIDAGDSGTTDADGSRSDIGAYGGPFGDW